MAALSRLLLSLSTPAHSRRFPWQTSSASQPALRRHRRRGSSRHRCDAASGPPLLRSCSNSLSVTRGSALRSSASWVRDNARSPSLFARHHRHCPRHDGDSPPLTTVEGIDCPHRTTISPLGIVILGLAIGDKTSCSPRRDPEIPCDRTLCPTSLHRNSSSSAASPPPNNDSVCLLRPSLPRRRQSPHLPPSNNITTTAAAAATAATAAGRRRRCWSANRRRRNPRHQLLTAWNRQCPARWRPLCAQRRQGRLPERQ